MRNFIYKVFREVDYAETEAAVENMQRNNILYMKWPVVTLERSEFI